MQVGRPSRTALGAAMHSASYTMVSAGVRIGLFGFRVLGFGFWALGFGILVVGLRLVCFWFNLFCLPPFQFLNSLPPPPHNPTSPQPPPNPFCSSPPCLPHARVCPRGNPSHSASYVRRLSCFAPRKWPMKSSFPLLCKSTRVVVRMHRVRRG